MDDSVKRDGGERASGIAALLLAVERDWYAVELARVVEVVAEPLVTALPTAQRPLIGVFNLRGQIVPMFDTAALVGVGAMVSPMFAVVVGFASGTAGLAATRMPEAVDLTDPLGSSEPDGARTFAVGRRVARLLDLDALLMTAQSPG